MSEIASQGAVTLWRNRCDKGAASELIASAHLMRRGYGVYRSESPSSPFDLAAYRDGVFTRVEVKSINVGAPLGVSPSIPWPTNDEWDLLLAVDPDTARCIEILTHDSHDARNIIRAAYGFPMIERSRKRGLRVVD